MKIIINSHVKSKLALDHLLESIKKYGNIDEYPIIVFIGGYYHLNDYHIEIREHNISYIFCNYNSIDLTAFIGLLELYNHNEDDYYMYLHDTCKIGPGFYNKLRSIDLTNISSIKINKKFSMCIGIYSQKIINENKDYLLKYKNKDDNNLLTIKYQYTDIEDYIFNNDRNNIVLDNYDDWNYTGPSDYYSTGIMRIVEYYPNIDLYKIKANWGQGNMTLNN